MFKFIFGVVKGLFISLFCLFAAIGLGSFLEELRRAKLDKTVTANDITDPETEPSTQE